MNKKTKYPYSLEKKEDALKLTIEPQMSLHLPYLSGLILFVSMLIFQVSSLALMLSATKLTLGFIIINSIVFLLECVIILFFFSKYWWRKKGVEIFTLYPGRLDYEQINKPFKPMKSIIHFQKIMIFYQSGEDYYTEKEALELGVELDLDKVIGNYPIQFYMNGGEEVVDSEREISIDIIRKIRDEYNTLISYQDPKA